MTGIEVLGFVAGALTTLATVPQVVRVFQLRSAREISLSFTLILMLGLALWLSYGIVRRLAPLIYWNAIGLGLIALLLYAKLRYGRQDTVLPPAIRERDRRTSPPARGGGA